MWCTVHFLLLAHIAASFGEPYCYTAANSLLALQKQFWWNLGFLVWQTQWAFQCGLSGMASTVSFLFPLWLSVIHNIPLLKNLLHQTWLFLALSYQSNVLFHV